MKVFLVLLLVAATSATMPEINRFMRPTGLERFNNLLRAVDHAGKIVGGEEAKPHSRPYQVGLLLTLDAGTAFCGGSLISKTYVLTAAHCVYDGKNTVSQFTVVLGAHNIYDEANSLRIQSRTATVHPAWNPKSLKNDMALIKLPTPVVLTENIQLAILPPYSSIQTSFSGDMSVVSGWGKSSDDDNNLEENLHVVSSEVISNVICNSKYLGIIQSSHLCTSGTNGKGSCNGDSGGPLTVTFRGKSIQAGIVSFGHAEGCEKGWPPVYTRVSSFLYWIALESDVVIQP